MIRNNIVFKTNSVVKYMCESLLDPGDRQKMLSVTSPRMSKLACSSITELVLIVLVVGSVMGLMEKRFYGELQGQLSSWRIPGMPEHIFISLAGKWVAYNLFLFFSF
jgi:hypothetical protein